MKIKQWSDNIFSEALAEIKNNSASICKIAAKCNIPESTLWNWQDMNKQQVVLVGSRKKTVLSSEEERQLPKCIEELHSLGFSPTSGQVIDLMKDYVALHKLNMPFKENIPGKEWLRNFLRCNSLSTKKANMISAVCMATTSNPFVVYNFFDTVQKIWMQTILLHCNYVIVMRWVSLQMLDNVKSLLWGLNNQTNLQVVQAENISVLLTRSASRKALDPFIIFSGVNFQSTWCWRNPLPNTCYGISKIGWMTTKIFALWF